MCLNTSEKNKKENTPNSARTYRTLAGSKVGRRAKGIPVGKNNRQPTFIKKISRKSNL